VKRDVALQHGRVVVRATTDDAIARLRQLNLRKKVGTRLTDEERDAAILALLQTQNLL
jgi:hypothetical protein